MALQQKLLPERMHQAWACCRRKGREEFFIGDEEPAPAMPTAVFPSRSPDEVRDLANLHTKWLHDKAVMESSVTRAWWLATAGLTMGLVACVGFAFLWLRGPAAQQAAGPGPTELAFSYFEETLKMWDAERTKLTFAEGAVMRFYNQATKEERNFLGQSGAADLLTYAASLGCARLHDTIVVREVDETARMVYIAWDYPKSLANFCGPSAESYIFDSNYKISRINALVDWRTPKADATQAAFQHFEAAQEAWDLDATAATFAEDAVIRFHNQGTGGERVFKGRAGAKELLTYAQGLGCATKRDQVTVREVDEAARMVYISWKYPKSEGVSNFCKPSTEVYTFDKDYKISRLNTMVDWRPPRLNATLKAFNNFELVLKTWDFEKTVETFSKDTVVTFYNQGTKELHQFKGRAGARDLLVYATGLGCAKTHDNIKVRKVDEEAKTVYIAWEYPPSANTSRFHCGSSAEMYLFDDNYEIYRMNALVDWGR